MADQLGTASLSSTTNTLEVFNTIEYTMGSIGYGVRVGITSLSNTATASATMSLSGVSAITSSSNTLTSNSAVDLSGVASIASTANTLASSGSVDLSGAVSIASTSNAVSVSGSVDRNGSASIISTTNTISSTSVLNLSGAVSIASTSNTLTAVSENTIFGTATITSNSNIVECFDTIEYTMGIIGTDQYGIASIASNGNSLSATGKKDISISASIESVSNTVSASGTVQGSTYISASISSTTSSVECFDTIEYTMGSVLHGLAFGSASLVSKSTMVAYDSIIYTMGDVRDYLLGTASLSSTSTLTATAVTDTIDKFGVVEMISDNNPLTATANVVYSASASLSSASFMIYIEGGAEALSNYDNPSGTITDYNWGATFTGWNPQATITPSSNGAIIT